MGWCRYGATKCSKKATKEKKIDHRKNKKRERGENMGQRKIAHNVFLFLTDEKKRRRLKKKVRKSSNRRRQEREEQEANRSSMETIPQW